MAWKQDTSTDSVLLADHADLSLPDGDWTLAIWVKQTTGVQAYQQRIFANGDSGTTNEYYFLINSTGSWEFDGYDGDGTVIFPVSTGTPFVGNTSWTHLCAVRSGSTITLYRNGVSDGSATDANFDGVNSANSLTFGNRAGGTQNRALVGSEAEFAKWDRALSTTEISNLAAGYSPSFYPTNLKVYVPMYSGDYTEKILGLTVTNNGTVGDTHPVVFYPLQPPTISNTNTFYAPTLVAGLVTLLPGLFSNTTTFYSPTLVPSTMSLSVPLLTNVNTFYDVTLYSFFTLQPGLVGSTNVFYGIVLVPGSVTLAPPLLTNSNTFYLPTLAQLTLLDAPFLSSGAVIYPPTLVYTQTILPPLVSSTSVIYAPTLRVIFSFVQPNTASDFTILTPNSDSDFTYVTPNSANDFTEV